MSKNSLLNPPKNEFLHLERYVEIPTFTSIRLAAPLSLQQ